MRSQLERNTVKILRLTIKKKWFDMIRSGEKTEEYREIKPYYLVRFIDWLGMAMPLKVEMCIDLSNIKSAAYWNFSNNYCQNLDYDAIQFVNGYQSNSPRITVKCLSIEINTGKPEWGAEPDKLYFVIKLGKIIEE